MPQTKYKLDRNRRGIVIRYCRLYDEYIKSTSQAQQNIAQIIGENKFLIGAELPEEISAKLREAVWYSTCYAYEYPYEVWDLPTISRNDFYERKREFIYRIARDIEI